MFSRAASCRRWCWSMRSPGCSRARSRTNRRSARRSRRTSKAGSSSRSTRGRRSSAGGASRTCCVSGDHARIEEWRREQSRATRSARMNDFYAVLGVLPEASGTRSAPPTTAKLRFDDVETPEGTHGCGSCARRTRCSPTRTAAAATTPRATAGTRSRSRSTTRSTIRTRRRRAAPFAEEAEPKPGDDDHPHTWNPVTRATRGLPRGWRIAIDWVVTIVGAIAIVLAIKAWVVNPYRIPSSSMEPTLHCARPSPGCEARFSDRVLANRFIYHFRKPHRGDIIVFKTPPLAKVEVRRRRDVRQAADRTPGGDLAGEERVHLHRRQEADRALHQGDRATPAPRIRRKIPDGMYFMMGDNRTQSCDSASGGGPRRT